MQTYNRVSRTTWFWAGVIVFIFSATALRPATITVCDEANLRTAIAAGGTVLFDCDGTITLSNTITITADTLLDGNGRAVTISGNRAVRVFYVNPGIRFTVCNLTVSDGAVIGTNATVAGAPGEDAWGAGVYNRGELILFNCVFTNHLTHGGTGGPTQTTFTNTIRGGSGGTGGGAAIYNDMGAVWSTNATFAGNSATGGPGGAGQSLGIDSGPSGAAFGAAVFLHGGAYDFNHCTFSRNIALGGQASPIGLGSFGVAGLAMGGALYSLDATGAMAECHFLMNRAKGGGVNFSGESGAGMGGAICISNGVAAIARTTFSANVAEAGVTPRFGVRPAEGGAIANFGSLTIRESLLAGNSTLGTPSSGSGGDANGGAIDNSGALSVISCSLITNEVRGGNSGNAGGPFSSWPAGNARGGAIRNTGVLFVTNSTFAGNVAQGGNRQGFSSEPGGEGKGGAIANLMSLTLAHVTLGSNAAVLGSSPGFPASQGQGGGLYSSSTALSTLQNTLLAGNISGSNGFGALVDQGNNLSSDSSCQFTALGSLNNTDPLLSPLDDFGGPTPTMALLAGSPAINAALSTHCTPTDQRGVTRPFGSGCDIGAFESAPPYTVRGRIHGYKPPQGISVTSGSASTTSDASGKYILFGLSPGTHNIVPSSPEVVCIPNNRSLNVSSDILNIDFKAYRFNGLTVDGHSNQSMTVVYAGVPGHTKEIQSAPAITGSWSPFSTNTVEPDGIVTFQVPVATAPSHQFFRARHITP